MRNLHSQYALGVNRIGHRRYLSAPNATETDISEVVRALDSGWVAPSGPDLTQFESDMAKFLGVDFAVGLNSGTAALHLGLKYQGVTSGSAVLVPSLTFGSTAFAVTYLGAEPVFVDVDESWNMDPVQSRIALETLTAEGKKVTAVVPVDLYGSPANYGELMPLFGEFGIPVFEDAAEGLGGEFGSRKLGGFGGGAALSFNGNKILTTSGGGMLVTDDEEFAAKVRFWATQSREDYPWYEHEEIGFNYRLSNILAALGRSQLKRIDATVARRRQARDLYRMGLETLEGIWVQQDPAWGRSNAWLTVVRFDLSSYADAPNRVRVALENSNIESRPIWKPMHQQPVFSRSRAFLSGASDAIYRSGLCLPSGPAITDADIEEICFIIDQTLRE